jgi:predicted phosphate transport protein (TIGR00153 family)
MAFSLLPREDTYFAHFTEMTVKIQEAAGVLVQMGNETGDGLAEKARQIKAIETACDEVTHNITTRLNKSFITPFDREDIYALAGALDDVIDYIDAGARAIVMYDIRELNDSVRRSFGLIQALVKEIHEAISMLKKPVGMSQHIVEIHRLENEADETYFRAIGDLFKDSANPIDVIKWKELYEILENTTDRCEAVANIIESIVLKHN